MCGIVGSLCQNSIPVNDLEVEGSLQMRVTRALTSQGGKWSDTPNNAVESLTFRNIEFYANMIRLSDAVLALVNTKSCTMYTESYNNI